MISWTYTIFFYKNYITFEYLLSKMNNMPEKKKESSVVVPLISISDSMSVSHFKCSLSLHVLLHLKNLKRWGICKRNPEILALRREVRNLKILPTLPIRICFTYKQGQVSILVLGEHASGAKDQNLQRSFSSPSVSGSFSVRRAGYCSGGSSISVFFLTISFPAQP